MTLAPGTVFAGFTIEATLGVGGMGTVYLARHPRLPRSDALKLLRPELSYDPDFAVRFAREADIAARLSHPNIVGVNDRGEEDGQLWISMPFVDGTDAEAALAECGGRMPALRAVRIVGEIAAALDFAHRNGLWHRDVKPANILLTASQDDEPERVMLTDFGIAKAADEGRGLTKTGNVIATFDYAPPEQIEGRAIDHRVDIYALGCVLHKLLTGSVPYPGTNLAVPLHGHLNLPPPRPTDLVPWLAPGLDEVVGRAMAKAPNARFPSCRALAAAARAALTELPTPPPMPYSITITRVDRATGHSMTLGPLDTDALSPADRDGLLALVKQSRLFDLPAQLPAPEPDRDRAASDPGGGSGGVGGNAITIAVRAGARTGVVSYVPEVTPKPPEFDDLLSGLEARLPWRTTGAGAGDGDRPAQRSAAPVTVVEQRRDAPGRPDPGWVGGVPPAALPAPPSRRGRLVASLLVALLVGAAGLTAFLLIDDPVPTSGGSGASTDGSGSPATSAATMESADQSGPPSSAELGLPSGPPLADSVLVASREVDGNVDLYALDTASGNEPARLTSDGVIDYIPVIAPDRTSVIYLSERAGGVALWVVGTDGAGARPLFDDDPPGCETIYRPAWNPVDPSMLAALCLDPTGSSSLRLLSVSGEPLAILDPGLPRFDDLAFSPDGSTLVYWASADPAATDGPLFALAVDGSSAPVQLTGAAHAGSADPLWSPDGTEVAFRARVDAPGSNSDIFVMAADGSSPRVLAPAPGIDQDPVWSPDGTMIAYKSDRPDPSGNRADRLWIMNADGSNSRLVSQDVVADGFPPAWSHR